MSGVYGLLLCIDCCCKTAKVTGRGGDEGGLGGYSPCWKAKKQFLKRFFHYGTRSSAPIRKFLVPPLVTGYRSIFQFLTDRYNIKLTSSTFKTSLSYYIGKS